MTQALLVQRTTVLLIIELLEQAMEQLVPLLAEANQAATALEVHLAGPVLTLQALIMHQADRVLAVSQAPQVEVLAGPQEAAAQEDPEEGGINSPLFLSEIYLKNNLTSLVP